MRTGDARGHTGHFHEAGFYRSDAEFAALIVPFAEEGIAAGEPVIPRASLSSSVMTAGRVPCCGRG